MMKQKRQHPLMILPVVQRVLLTASLDYITSCATSHIDSIPWWYYQLCSECYWQHPLMILPVVQRVILTASLDNITSCATSHIDVYLAYFKTYVPDRNSTNTYLCSRKKSSTETSITVVEWRHCECCASWSWPIFSRSQNFWKSYNT